MRPIAWCVTLVCVLVAGAGAARAEVDGASAEAKAKAKAHFERGETLSANGKYAEALAEFTAGYDLSHRPLFLFNMAECLRLLGQLSRAEDTYARYLREDPQGRMTDKARERLAELESHVVAAEKPVLPVVAEKPVVKPVAAVEKPVVKTTPIKRTPARPVKPAETAPATPVKPVAIDLTVRHEPAPSTPVWKRWPLWAGVGAAVVAGSILIYATSQGGGDCSGAGCTDIDWR